MLRPALPRVTLTAATVLALLAPVVGVGTTGAVAVVAAPARDTAGVPQVDLVADLWPGAGSGRPGGIVDLDGVALFVAATGDPSTTGLWRSDGTAEGTSVVLARSTGRPTVVGDIAFFRAVSDDGDEVADLWRTDGTPEGTAVVSSSSASAANGAPSLLTAVGDRLYFNRVGVGGDDEELWTSDGTAEGTRRVADINPGGSSSPRFLTAVGDEVWFRAFDPTHGTELWRSDGTETGTAMVADLAPGLHPSGYPLSSSPEDIVSTAGTVFFTARDADLGLRLWTSDGTPAGTRRVADVRVLGDNSVRETIALSDRVLFWAFDETSAGHPVLWTSDGTSAGTRRLSPLIRASYDLNQVVMDGVAYFAARDGAVIELWRSDGTEAGTTRITDLDPTPVRPGDLGGSFPALLTVVGDRLYFTAHDPVRGRSLWVTDGTVEGLALVEDLDLVREELTPPADRVESLAAVGDDLYLSVGDPVHGRELWSTASPSAALPKAINDVRPTVTGTARVGTHLVADPGVWAPASATFGYQWLLDGIDLDGRTGPTLPLSQDLVGRELRVRVQASSPGHRSRSVTSAPVTVRPGQVANRSRPQVVGTPRVASTLTARVGTWTPGSLTYSYRWLVGGTPVAGAYGRTFKVPARAAGRRVTVQVTGRRSGWVTAQAVSPPTAPVERGRFRVTRQPSIIGTPRVGSRLRVRLGAITPTAHHTEVRWFVDGQPVSRGWLFVPRDRGTRIAVKVRRFRAGWHVSEVTIRASRVVQRRLGDV